MAMRMNWMKKTGIRIRNCLAVLLTAAILCSGCSAKVDENVPEDLRPFEEDLEGRSREQIREYFWKMIYKTIDANNAEPYLLTRITVAKAQVPEFSETGQLEGFKPEPYYQDSFRVVIPSGDKSQECSSLEWNTVGDDREVTAWKGGSDSITKAIWEQGDSKPYVRVVTNTELGVSEAARSMQLRWLAGMFSTGLYQTTRWGKVLDFSVNPMVFPANGEMFNYAVEKQETDEENTKKEDDKTSEKAEDLISSQQPDQESMSLGDESLQNGEGNQDDEGSGDDSETDPENQNDYILKISIRDPNSFAQSLKRARLGFDQTAGCQLSKKKVVFDDYTFTRYEFEVLCSPEGAIKRVTENIDIRFIAYVNKKSVSVKESSTTVWTIDPYPQGTKYQGMIDQMAEGEKPEGLEQLIRE